VTIKAGSLKPEESGLGLPAGQAGIRDSGLDSAKPGEEALWVAGAVAPAENASRVTPNAFAPRSPFPVSRSTSFASEAQRSEFRELAQETATVILGREKAVAGRLGVVAGKLEKTFAVVPVDVFITWLREEASKLIGNRDSSVGAATTRVTKDIAEAAVARLLKALEASGLKGNLAIGFDTEPGRGFFDALRQLRSGIGIAVFSKAMARTLPADLLKGLRTQTVTNFRSYKPFAAENKTVPVLARDSRSGELASNDALFGVSVDAGSVEGEPFLEVVENVVMIASGLLMADRLKSPADLKNTAKLSEIKAELAKILFNLDVNTDPGIFSFQGRNLIVHRGLLQKFLLEYQAQAAIKTAA
jgi:hypothetical protein